jgi:hypothetical protein
MHMCSDLSFFFTNITKYLCGAFECWINPIFIIESMYSLIVSPCVTVVPNCTLRGLGTPNHSTCTVTSLLVEMRAEESSARQVEEALSSLACMKVDSALATGE